MKVEKVGESQTWFVTSVEWPNKISSQFVTRWKLETGNRQTFSDHALLYVVGESTECRKQ